jgi:uncharacterized RDD family membrane protein YckC
MAELVAPAPLWRRLMAAFYDGLLLLAVWFVAAVVDEGVREWFTLPYSPQLYRGYLFLIGLAFFGWFWTHGGQTLGMRAWRLQVRRTDGAPLHWPAACARYACAWIAWLPLGLGVLWSAVDSERKAVHDRLSGTEVVLLPKKG